MDMATVGKAMAEIATKRLEELAPNASFLEVYRSLISCASIQFSAYLMGSIPKDKVLTAMEATIGDFSMSLRNVMTRELGLGKS